MLALLGRSNSFTNHPPFLEANLHIFFIEKPLFLFRICYLVCELLFILQNSAHSSPTLETGREERWHLSIVFPRHCVRHFNVLLFYSPNNTASKELATFFRKGELSKNLANTWWNQDLNPNFSDTRVYLLSPSPYCHPYSLYNKLFWVGMSSLRFLVRVY